MAEMGNSGMMSQAELDALIASAGDADETAESEMNFGGMPDDAGNDLSSAAAWETEPPAATPQAKAPSPSNKLGLVDLPSFAPAAAGSRGRDGVDGIGRVRDIPLEVTVELGRTRLLIRDILDLSAGSIIELDKIAGEPVDLFANGMLVARGEVIVIDDNFGVRVTEIITASERSAEKDAQSRAA